MAGNESKLINLWFEHDENANNDGKILKMFRDFRKKAKEMSREELESFVAVGAYGIFWRLVEFMHGNLLAIDEADIIADDLRVDTKFVEMILKDFEFFEEVNGYYISQRVLRNLERRKEKSKKNSDAVNIRWLLYAFNEAYKEFFSEEPLLTSEEIETLKKCAKKMPDLKDKLRDIIFTLTKIKFDKDISFKPCANWLLKDNNLYRVLNGEFGKLQHKPTEKEIKEAQKQEALKQAQQNAPSELEIRCECATGKSDAISIIKEYYEGKTIPAWQGKAMVVPTLRNLMKRFDITDKEVLEQCQG